MAFPSSAPFSEDFRSSVSPQALIVPIACSSVWEAHASLEGGVVLPDVGFVEPMLRRRLSPLAKMMLRVAYDCARDVPDVRIVYASRHGELVRTTTMLESLAAKEELSPTLFSMSVLNASAGLFSILQKNTAPSTAISAGRASFGYGLLEAGLQLAQQPAQPVLFVYADEPAPAVYQADEPPNARAHALALLLESSGKTRISCSFTAGAVAQSREEQSHAFMRCLDHGESEWSEAGRTWRWKKEA